MKDKKIKSEEAESLSYRPNSKRRFLTKAGLTTPAIMALVSRPALAATCFSPSRSLSRNTSISQEGKYGECNGESPGNYKAQSNSTANAYHWPSGVSPSDKFHDIFSGPVAGHETVNDDQTSKTLLEVLSLKGNEDSEKLAFHIIGAYLNTMQPQGSDYAIPPQVLTPQGVIDIWNAYVSDGYYEPVAGVQWGAGQIVTYLQSNGIAP